MRADELDTKLTGCTRCGTCLKDCPIYLETMEEAYTSRAKVQLSKAVARGRLQVTGRMAELAGMCLLCRACEASCPNKVNGPEFTLHLRDLGVRAHGQSLMRKLVFRGVLPRVGFASFLGRARWLAGPGALRRGSGAPRPARGRVAYFHGCATSLFFPRTGRAVLEVLRRAGYDVVVPGQCCCGVPAAAGGDLTAAREMAARNLRSFAGQCFDYVVADCASCGSTLKEYGGLLGTEAAGAFADRVRDVVQLLAEGGYDEDFGAIGPTTVTYHDPCHLKRWQNVGAEPRAILKSIPGVTLAEMRDADRCCGAAGSFALAHTGVASRIGERKVDDIIASGAQMVATGCPACRLWISRGLRRAGQPKPVVHPVELMARSYRGRAGGSGWR